MSLSSQGAQEMNAPQPSAAQVYAPPRTSREMVRWGKQPAVAPNEEQSFPVLDTPTLYSPSRLLSQQASFFNDSFVNYEIGERMSHFVNDHRLTMQAIHGRNVKVADYRTSLEQLIKQCEAATAVFQGQLTILEQDTTTGLLLDLEAAKVHTRRAISFSDNLVQVTQAVLLSIQNKMAQAPQEGTPSSISLRQECEPIVEVIRAMENEVSALQKSLPSVTKPLLSALLILCVVAPLSALVWYGFVSLGFITLPPAWVHGIAGIGSTILAMAGIAKNWVDFKNSCSERAHENTRVLIGQYNMITELLKRFQTGLDSANIESAYHSSQRAADAAASSVVSSYTAAAASIDTNRKLEEVRAELDEVKELKLLVVALEERLKQAEKDKIEIAKKAAQEMYQLMIKANVGSTSPASSSGTTDPS
jgi:hypothetical protein